MSWTERMVETLVRECRGNRGIYVSRRMVAATRLLKRAEMRGDDVEWISEIVAWNYSP